MPTPEPPSPARPMESPRRMTALYSTGDLSEHRISRRVPQRVVDALEVVDVQEQDRQGLVAAPRMGDHPVQAVLQPYAVGQARDGIVVRQAPHSFRRLHTFRDVLHGSVQAHEPARGVAFSEHPALDRGHGTVGTLDPARDHARPAPPSQRVTASPAWARSSGCTSSRTPWSVPGNSVTATPRDAVDLLGPVQASGTRVPLPAAEPRHALRLREPRLAGRQVVHGGARAHDVAQPVSQHRQVDRLRHEVRRARLVGGVDGADVVPACQHHDRRVPAVRAPAKRPARGEAVHSGHDDIEQDNGRREEIEFLERIGTIRRLRRRTGPPSAILSEGVPAWRDRRRQ